MHSAIEILSRFWNYSNFRSPQDEIVNAVIDNKDVLAILPTGGGKSICYQVPALFKGGLCLVVSPLTALMQDQVDDLLSKGIKAKMLTAFMNKFEIDAAMNECVYGKVSFLFVSPERLLNKAFLLHFEKMPVSLIAIDEAHCISQWGHDFRPAYLEISKIREIHPKVNMLALTATATNQTKEEIIEKLALSNPAVVQGDLIRPNLAYGVISTEDKSSELINWIRRFKGAMIVYAQSRQKVEEISRFLCAKGFDASFFHAGLHHEQKKKVIAEWMDNSKQIIVATNAFGMGINKPDVDAVIHWEVPSSPEAYFQEAGRAGRGGQKAYAILLSHPSDKKDGTSRIESLYPERETIIKTYQYMCDGFQLPIGSGSLESFALNWQELSSRSGLSQKKILASLSILNNAGFIQMNDSFSTPSTIRFLFSHEQLIIFKSSHPNHERIIDFILRMYGVSDIKQIKIDEFEIAKLMSTSLDLIQKKLRELSHLKVLEYQQQIEGPSITMLLPRVHPESLIIPKDRLEMLHSRDESKWLSMWDYIDTQKCRSVWMVNYFDHQTNECGICDNCKKNLHISLQVDSLEKLFKEKKISEKQINSIESRDIRNKAWDMLRLYLDEGSWLEVSDGEWMRNK